LLDDRAIELPYIVPTAFRTDATLARKRNSEGVFIFRTFEIPDDFPAILESIRFSQEPAPRLDIGRLSGIRILIREERMARATAFRSSLPNGGRSDSLLRWPPY
jgi:hypothetical protein